MRLIDADALKEEFARNEDRRGYIIGDPDDIIDNAPTVEPESEVFEWCHDCKEYDQEQHCCHRWTSLIRQTVEELRAEYPTGEWIPVSERLPEYSGLYLISVDDLVTVANFTGTYFMPRGGGRVKVYAWQPLPEVYKKGTEE